ncbi:hypothetical protein BROUX41_002697 [Berkeleyomyces rouxiae]|uniref:uncharacterized protein n=1 Tax=Berkeleyomyces rouxiae TaxID=2035830 RepID=UPI003B81797B
MTADDFDKSLNSTESWSGILKLRAKMSQQACGAVLEVAAGTGRNMEYYDWSTLFPKTPADILRRNTKKETRVTSYTAVDISSEMLEVADAKFRSAVPLDAAVTPCATVIRGTTEGQIAGSLDYSDGVVRLVRSDVQSFIPAPVDAKKYDTVIQTFGLCSVSSPESVLANIAAVTQLGTGKIILLEHGKASYGFVNRLLDQSAPQHFEKYGCWWNRDIEQIVRQATEKVPGLEIVKIQKPWFQLGTLYWIELRVNS